ncbi:MAG: hypothetical protein PHH69_01890 [Candidatus Omnitrophica bacterium]|nr:hypothetical protein [Candidatus Omnitrophota bacterium]MDD5610281.1 hypothetical protein [Candidatus Omnitrophota bacterium]
MKLQNIFFITLGAVFIFSTQVHAAPCYGTHMPARNRITLGVEYNFVVKRSLQHENGKIKNPDEFLALSYGVFDWLSIDLKGGAGKIDWKDSPYGDLKFSTGFSGAYGFRLRFYENKSKKIRLVGGFQHISVHPKTVDTAAGKYKAIADEWQGSVLGSVSWKKFTPYFGFKYGTYDLIRWIDDANRKRYKAEDNFGLVAGLDFNLTKNVRLNTEFDFLDGAQAAASLNFDF